MKQIFLFLAMFVFHLQINAQIKIYKERNKFQLETPDKGAQIGDILKAIAKFYNFDLVIKDTQQKSLTYIVYYNELENLLKDLEYFKSAVKYALNDKNFNYKIEERRIIVSFDSSFKGTSQVEIKKENDTYALETSFDGARVNDILNVICKHYGYHLIVNGHNPTLIIMAMNFKGGIDKDLSFCKDAFKEIAPYHAPFSYEIEGKTVKVKFEKYN